MVRTPNGARALAKAEALDALPEAVRGLPAPKQAAYIALTEGRRYRDVAKAAGVDVHTVWRWVRDEPLKSAADMRLLHLSDDAGDTMEARILEGLEDDADDKAKDRGLRASVHVHRSLGIGQASAAAHASEVTVTVNVGLPDVLGRALPVESAPLDVDAWQADASLVPVSSTQPSRARASSQRAGDAASDAPSPGQDSAE